MNFIKLIFKYFLYKLKWHGKTTILLGSNVSLDSTFEGMSKIHRYVYFKGHLGRGSYISDYCILSANIGRFTSIAPFVRCNPGRHPLSIPYVTTSPCFFSLYSQAQCGDTFASEQCFEELKYADESKQLTVNIGNDCWIGEGAFLTGGINIADGAVVLARSVVTHDVPPYAIVGGTPARILKYRYDEETISFLLRTKWWEKDVSWHQKHWRLLNDLDGFIRYFSKEVDRKLNV